MTPSLRIFVSSPGDVIPERRRAALVIEKLAKDYARFFDIKPCLWETEPMLASGSFQDSIVSPDATDILILILWSRLGTPLPAQTGHRTYRGIDGRTPVTGTEWEFETALAAHRQHGAPDLLAYKKSAPPQAEYRSDADLEELRRQLQKLEEFWKVHFVDQGQFRAAFGGFESLDDFETRIESDLRRLIERRIADRQSDLGKTTKLEWLAHSPFRGLETYRFEHSPVFFGRSEATKTAVEYLIENADSGRPFLLVLGASGAGKSSLAQAGIVPALGVRGVVPGVGAWRRAVMRPGGHPDGPFMALSAALADDEALPEILLGQDVGAFARHLEAAAADPGFPVVASLNARETAARQAGDLLSFEKIMLILVVDQLEELFTLLLTSDRRQKFVRCLQGLMDSGRILVVATMRSDYWHRAAEIPLLVELAGGHRLDLLPPTQAEITEMIRRPAEAAGLTFETDPRSEIRLDASLAEEASHEPGALPLVSFMLDALYAENVEKTHGSVLRYATMQGLGGLKGAIAARAEAVYLSLPIEEQSTLPKLLRALVTVSRSEAEPTARSVSMADFAAGSAERRLVDALLDPKVRLLMADGDGSGASIRVAHEALIHHWERARRGIAQDRDDLRTRAIIEQAEGEWQAAQDDKRRGYLLRDPQLASALDLTRRWGSQLSSRQQAFVEASRHQARSNQRKLAVAAVFFFVLAIAASGAGMTAYRAQQRASSELTLSQIEQVRNRVFRARRLINANEPAAAMEVALSALPEQNAPGWPLMESAQRVLFDAFQANHLEMMLGKDSSSVTDAEISPDGKTVAVASADGSAHLFLVENGDELSEFKSGKIALARVRFSPDGRFLLTSTGARRATDSQIQIWSIESGKSVAAIPDPKGDLGFAYSPDGKRILILSNGEKPRVWSSETQQELFVLEATGATEGDFSPDGTRIGTRSGNNVIIWSAETGMRISAVADYQSLLARQSFSPDGRQIVGASSNNEARIWSTDSGQTVFSLHGHENSVLSAAFSPLGDFVVAGSADKTASTWSSSTGKRLRWPLSGHREPVRYVSVSPDGNWILTVSGSETTNASYEQSVRIFDARSGYLTALLRHDDFGFVTTAAFTPDSKAIITTAGNRTLVWSVDSGGTIGTFAHGSNEPAWSRDGQYAIGTAYTGTGDYTAWIDSAATGNIGKVHSSAPFYATAFSPDGSLIAVANGRTANILTRTADRVIAVLEGHTGIIRHVEFSMDGTRVITLSDDHTARLWSATGDTIAKLPYNIYPTGPVEVGSDTSLISPGRKWIATVNDKSTVDLWDADKGAPVRTITAPDTVLAALSSDSNRLLTVSRQNEVRVWDPQTGSQIVRLATDEHDQIWRATFSRDASRIISVGLASPDNVSIWDAATGERKIRLKNENALLIRQAAFAPNERFVFGWEIPSETRPPTVRIWSSETGQILSSVGGRDYVEWAAISADGKAILTAELYDRLRIRLFPDPDEIAKRATALVRRLTPLAQPRACERVTGVCEDR